MSGQGFPRGQQQQPDGAVRQSQIVTTFGPGSMLDLLNDAVLVGGLDFWNYDKGLTIPHIDEPRLRDAIVERFRQLGRELSQENPFRRPPAGNDREPTSTTGIQVLEFSQWFVCQNPLCRALVRKDGLEMKKQHYWHACQTGGKVTSTECVPVRFVLACPRGHADEFPWIAFPHEFQGRPRCASPSLTFEEGATGDFNEIRVHCACGASGRMADLLGDGLKLKCHGARPWLGPQGKEDCLEDAKLLVRTASNSYFPQVVSALSIPDPFGAIRDRVREVWDVLKSATKENLPIFRQIDKVRVALDGLADADVLHAIQALASDKPATQAPIRTAEYQQLTTSELELKGDLAPLGAKFFARRVNPREALPEGVGKLVVVSKLREVVAQIGFTRLEPVTPDVQGEYDLGVKNAALGLTTNWLPASEIYGEGVFLELDEKAVRDWEDRDSVKERARALAAGYDAWATDDAPPFPGARFYMLHSLAHLLMSAISLECGYAASSIRERIYCGPSSRDPTPMAAILLSTGTSGTEGTLGGLVEQGRHIREHLQHAYDLGRLCSNDPVCATHSPEKDHAERFLEGAACHGCLFVAECSCERFNRYLDRALVVPALGHPADLAFFTVRP
ncbi:MAG: DUF1998 domain-containing protein [Byssovorax sp.]